ncbi:E3 ubiquitin-protein ligase XBOS32, partial [Trifolium medium]|nr:E3 ubiquitin-protein ligase XBOS32 [Trifolium medium]
MLLKHSLGVSAGFSHFNLLLNLRSIGLSSGSTPLHYAACGGNAQCCQLLIAKGASLTAENANG